jgi:alpha-L-fucosidase 2
MKKFLFLFFVSMSILCYAQPQHDTQLKLWYNHPAKKWTDALPVGNGRLGAMVYGNPWNENIQLNEITVWGGQPNRNDNPEAKQALPEVRKLIFEGKYDDAQDLVNKKIISKISQGMPYQTVGNLHLVFPGHEQYSDYYRELDIEKPISTTRYTVGGVKYESTVIASFQDQVIIVRITADQPKAITFNASMSRPAKVDIAVKGND